MASTQDTADIARGYFNAWTTGDSAGVRKALAEDFVFESAMMTLTGRESVLNSQAWPKEAKTTMVADVYDGDQGFQMYDAVNGNNTVRIAEHLRVRDGQLVHSTIVVDAAAFMAFMGMGG